MPLTLFRVAVSLPRPELLSLKVMMRYWFWSLNSTSTGSS
jgi:hypothetical protein